MKGVIINGLKYGGLSFSAILTIWLFTDLFWDKTPMGGFLILAALILFEGGAILWTQLVDHAKGIQFLVAWAGVSICVFSSVASSICQIVLATKLYSPGDFDVPLFTLSLIGLTLTTNVGGIILFQFFDPDTLATQFTQFTEAFSAIRSRDKVNEIWAKADVEADKLLKAELPKIAAEIAAERVKDVLRLAKAASPGGDNSKQQRLPEIVNRPPRKYDDEEAVVTRSLPENGGGQVVMRPMQPPTSNGHKSGGGR